MADLAEWDLLGDKKEYEAWLRRQAGGGARAGAEGDDELGDDNDDVEAESRVLQLPDDVQAIIETDPELAEVLRTTFVQKVLERLGPCRHI